MGVLGRGALFRRKASLFLVVTLPMAMACQGESDEILPEDAEGVVSLAEPVAAELLRTLVGGLTSAMEEGGATHAIGFCANEAMPLTRGVETGLAGGWELKRTSFRVRNPMNAPDEAEEEALLYFEERILAQGEAPANLVQRVSDSEYRYYRPLFIADVCVRCHGEVDQLEAEVRTALTQLYPEDLATGYVPGDFRGLVRVSVPAASLEDGPGREGGLR